MTSTSTEPVPAATPLLGDDILFAHEACKILDVDRSMLHRLIERGVLKAGKGAGLRGAYYFRRTDVLAAASDRRAALIARANRIQVAAPAPPDFKVDL